MESRINRKPVMKLLETAGQREERRHTTFSLNLFLSIAVRYMILNWLTKFHPNRNTLDRVMTSYQFFKIAPTELQIYFWLRFYCWHSFKNRNLFAFCRRTRYFSPRLRSYYYFRFWKTSGHHIGMLLLASILTYLSSSTYHFASIYQISFK